MHVQSVQAAGWFVQNKQRSAARCLAEFGREFDSLSFAAGQGVSWLAEAQVSEPNVAEGCENTVDLVEVSKVLSSFIDPHVQYIGDGLAIELNRQRLPIEPSSPADVARHEDVGQELHLHAFHALPFALRTVSVFHIKTKPPSGEAAES